MTAELQNIFNNAIRAYLPPLNDSNPVPVIGIAFANAHYPRQVEKIINAINERFRIEISGGHVQLNLRVSKAVSREHLFDASLNYEQREFKLFKSQVDSKSKGAFVVGAVHDGRFMIVSENISSFEPFQVESFNII